MLVDLRSDTVTRPSPAMRRAMADAEVGDDVYGEDPTSTRSRSEVAALFGHGRPRCSSRPGPWATRSACGCSCASGGEVLCDADAHIVTYEHGAAADARRHPDAGPGRPAAASSTRSDVEPDDPAARAGTPCRPPRSRSSRHAQPRRRQRPAAGARSWSCAASRPRARSSLHCDGARIWNAAVATGTPLATYGAAVRHAVGLPVQGARCAGRLGAGRRRPTAASRRPGCCASGSAAGCARPACSPPPGSTRCATTSSGSPRTTPGRDGWASELADRRARPALPGGDEHRGARGRRTPRRWPRRRGRRACWSRLVSPTRIRLVTHLDVDDDRHRPGDRRADGTCWRFSARRRLRSAAEQRRQVAGTRWPAPSRSAPNSACGPSHSAVSGCGCTSTITPSAPAAMPARASGTTSSRRPGRVRRVDDHRQVRRRLDERHGADVEGVADRRLEGADAALAQHDVEVAALRDVLGGHQPLLDGGGHPALEHDRLAGSCRPPAAGRSSACCGCRSAACRRTRRPGRRRAASTTSVTIGSPVRPRTSARIFRPASPRPWKAYGEVRGL